MLQQQPEQLRWAVRLSPPWAAPPGWPPCGATRAACYCGGALVAPRVVMTAAHCVSSPDAGRAYLRLGVRVGSYEMDSADPASFQARRAVQTAVHPGFDSPTVANDVALLLLYSPVAHHAPDDGRRWGCIHLQRLCQQGKLAPLPKKVTGRSSRRPAPAAAPGTS